jgi:predicted enzyme related to lactoylglutathione lyase
MQRKMAGQPFMNYIAVKSVDAALARVIKAGGAICMPKTEIGQGMGWIAAFQDTEGNMMGFHQAPKQPAMKAAAKKSAKKPAKKAARKK